MRAFFFDTLRRRNRLRDRAAQSPPAITATASEFSRGKLGLPVDDWQVRFLNSKDKRKVLVGARQCGKSTAGAALAVCRMAQIPGFKVIVISSSERQSRLFVEKCRGYVRRLGEAGRGDGINKSSVLMKNGSSIVGLPCTAVTTRGYTADLLFLDEAAGIPDTVYVAVRPMLASTDGELVLSGTAAEPIGFFYEASRSLRPGWCRITVRASDVSRFSKEFLEEEKYELGADAFAREYGCEFADSGIGVFDRRIVEAAFSDKVKPLFG